MADPLAELAKFRELVGGQNAPLTNVSGMAPQAVASAQDEISKFRALVGGQNIPPSGVSAVPNLSLQEKEGRLDSTGEIIPIDFKSGMPLKDYSVIARQRDPESQLMVLKEMYPDRKSRMLDSGDIVIEVTDSKTGKPKDVSLNPAGLNPHDLIDLSMQVPEIAAGIAAAWATKGRGLWKTAGQILASAFAAGGAGAAKDVAVRTTEGLPIRPGEIAQTRGSQVALDMFMQSGIGLGAKMLRVGSPFAKEIKPGSLEFDFQEGQRFFKEVFGEEIPTTPAKRTGSSALYAVEAMESKMPGSRNVFWRIQAEKDEALKRIQAKALGQTVPEEEIGEQAIEVLKQREVLPIENALQQARTIAEQKGQKRVLELIDEAVGMPKGERISPTMAGVKTLEEFEGKLAEAKAKVDLAYAEVNKLPGGSGEVLSGNAAATAAAEIRKELPSVLKQVEKKSPLLDEFGRESAITVEQKEVLKSGVPEGLIKALEDLESLKGGKVSLQTLTNMKRAAYDEIAKTEAVPGVKERWFNKIASAYEQGIQKGIEETGDPALKAALTNAKETYKKELLPFDRPGVKELAKEEFDTARLSPEQVANRLFEGPKAIENFKLLKETLGAENPTFRVLKRAWADTQIADVSDPVTGSINADKLQNLFHKLNVDRPELAQEIFGKNYRAISEALALKSGAKKLDSLDQSEVRALLNLKDPTVKDFEMLVSMQKNRDTAYANGLLRDVADGLPIESKLKPTDFVNRISNANTPTKDVERVLGAITKENPELRDSIATAQFYKLLDAASVVESKTAATGLAGGRLNLSPTKLAQALGNPGSPERLRNELLLGVVPSAKGAPKLASRVDVLENIVKVMASDKAATEAFSASAGLASGAAIQQITRGPLQYVADWAKKFVIATAYTTETGQKLVGNRIFSPENVAAISNTLIASEPFVSRAVETLGPDKAKELIGDLKQSIDKYLLNFLNSPRGREAAELSKFMQGQPAKLKIQPTP